jgi:hypothetical protein
MANFWQPRIDTWLENINVNNTPSFPISYQYAPNEGEEKNKVFVSGHGHIPLKQLKQEIVDMIDEASALARSDDLKDIEKLEQTLISSPDLNNKLKQYINALRDFRASRIG